MHGGHIVSVLPIVLSFSTILLLEVWVFCSLVLEKNW